MELCFYFALRGVDMRVREFIIAALVCIGFSVTIVNRQDSIKSNEANQAMDMQTAIKNMTANV